MLGLSIPEVAVRAHAGLDPVATTLIARMTAPPDATRAGLIDALVRALLTAGVWTKLDLLYVMAAADAQAARLNWVQNAYNLSAVNSPGFTVDRGYAGDGATSYLDTGFQAGVSAGSKALQDMVHLSAWSLSDADSSGVDVGCGSLFIQSRSSGNFGSRCMGTTTAMVAVASSLGHSAISRAGSAGYSRYRDGASLGDATATSAVPVAQNLLIGAKSSATVPNSFTTRRIAAMSCGSSLSAGEVAGLQAALAAYLTAVGAV